MESPKEVEVELEEINTAEENKEIGETKGKELFTNICWKERNMLSLLWTFLKVDVTLYSTRVMQLLVKDNTKMK